MRVLAAAGAIAALALGAIPGAAYADSGCHWEEAKTATIGKTDPKTRYLSCTPKAFASGCLKIFNDTCDAPYGCKPVQVTTTVIGGIGLLQNSTSTSHTHILLPGKAKGQRGQELAIAYGQYIKVEHCAVAGQRSADCHTPISRSYDQNSGGTGSPCNGHCRDGNCK